MTHAATPSIESTTIVREIEIRASAARVFAAITDPAQVTTWWGSADTYRCTTMEQDFRVGGKWRTTGHGADGKPFAVEGVYRIIDPPRVLEYTWRHDWGDQPEETVVRYELDEERASTRVRVVHSGFRDAKAKADHDAGWTRVLGWLTDYLQ
jgi:uncharacterized protein YndB with AHSA1/START domain